MDAVQKETRYQRLEDVLEPEMVKQYRIRRGRQCVYMPLFGNERYLCSCGTVNPLGENCYVCGLEPEPLTRAVLEELSRDAEERLAREAELRAEQEAKRLAREAALLKEKRRKRILKTALWSGSAVAVLALSILLFWMFTRVWIPGDHYKNALQALEEEDYPRAHRLFTLANGYEDSEDYLARFTVLTLTQQTEVGDAVSRVEYTYDKFGNRLIMTQDDYDRLADGQLVPTGKQTWISHYNEQGKPVQVEDFYGKVTYSYNEHGDVILEEEGRSDGTMESTRFYSYIYDDAGRMLESAEICSELISVNYSYEQTNRYTYDDADRVLSITTQANYPAATEGNFTSVTTNSFDAAGRLVGRHMCVDTPNDPSGACEILETCTYTASGGIMDYTRTVTYSGDQSRNVKQHVTIAYNERGDITEEKTQTQFPADPQRDVVQTRTVTYDREGRVEREVIVQLFADDTRQKQGGYTATTENSYDLFGRITGSRCVYDHADPERSYVHTEVFTYAVGGSLKKGTQTTKWREAGAETTVVTVEYNENGLPRTRHTVEDGTETVIEYTYAYFYDPEAKSEIAIAERLSY